MLEVVEVLVVLVAVAMSVVVEEDSAAAVVVVLLLLLLADFARMAPVVVSMALAQPARRFLACMNTRPAAPASGSSSSCVWRKSWTTSTW
jgi:hypothetical protein